MDAIDGSVLDRLFAVVAARRGTDPAISYTAKLQSQGTARIAQKFGEEAIETVVAAVAREATALVGESADLLYHLLVVWEDAGIAPGDVWTALASRMGVSGIAEKESRAQS